MSVLSLIPEERKKCFPSYSTESVYSSNPLKCALRKRKILHPLLSTSTMLTLSNSNNYKGGDRMITERVLSAKERRLKHLQNQLADAHFHLSELSNENRLLRSLQKRQDSALQKYENSNGDIPKLINGHTEELRSWQVRYKHLRSQFREVNQRLKDKDIELQHITDAHKHLLTLSKDSSLGEREKLKKQVISLTEKINTQNETINALQRRIALEAKSFKHQMNSERAKHKDTQQQLSEALSNSERLSSLVEIKEKIIASNVPKRVLPRLTSEGQNFTKPRLDNFNMDMLKNHLSGINLSIEGSSIPDNQATYSSKLNGNAKSTFTLNKKFLQSHIAEEGFQDSHQNNTQGVYQSRRQSTKTENESSPESNTYDNDINDYGLEKEVMNEVPSMKMFESDTDIPKSSDEDVRERVNGMKRQLSKQMRKESSSETSLNQSYSLRRKSSPENDCDIDETKSSICHNSDSEKDTLNKKISKNIVPRSEVNEDNNIDNHINLSQIEMSLRKLDELNETWDELEQNAVFQNQEAEAILETYCNDVVRKSNINHTNIDDQVPKQSVSLREQFSLNGNNYEKTSSSSSTTIEHNQEMNNSSKPSSRKMSTELNDEKKKKLLAALKAIDRGDEDGLNFDMLKKPKMKLKPSSSILGKK